MTNNYQFSRSEQAIRIVRDYIKETLGEIAKNIYIVWQCKTLQNWKALLASDNKDGMYYELTYNGDKREWYLDAYKKMENKVIEE